MDSAAISQLKTAHQLCVFTPKLGSISPPPIVSLPVDQDYQRKRVILRCGGIVKCAKEAEKMMILMEEELIGMKKLNEKCEGVNGGIAELMECLEREAIMGEDEGREPSDYNRRALIFDKSATVFQALKQRTPSPSASASAV